MTHAELQRSPSADFHVQACVGRNCAKGAWARRPSVIRPPARTAVPVLLILRVNKRWRTTPPILCGVAAAGERLLHVEPFETPLQLPNRRASLPQQDCTLAPDGPRLVAVLTVLPGAVDLTPWRSAPCAVEPAHPPTADRRRPALASGSLAHGRAARGRIHPLHKVHGVALHFCWCPHPPG